MFALLEQIVKSNCHPCHMRMTCEEKNNSKNVSTSSRNETNDKKYILCSKKQVVLEFILPAQTVVKWHISWHEYEFFCFRKHTISFPVAA